MHYSNFHENFFIKIIIIILIVNYVSPILSYHTFSELSIQSDINNTSQFKINITYTNPNTNFYSHQGNVTLKRFVNEEHSIYFTKQTDENGSIWLINTEKDYDFIVNNVLNSHEDENLFEENKICIIIPNTFTIKHTKNKFPIFSINQEDMYTLINTCYRNNPCALIQYQRDLLNYPLEYYLISISVVVLVSFVMFIIYFKIKCELHRRNILSFYQMINYLPFQIFLIGILITTDVYFDYKNKIEIKVSNSIMFNEILYVLLCSIFKTFFWSTLLLISYGWEITKNDLLSYEIKCFIFIFLFIYTIFCLDKVFDLFLKDVTFLIFTIKEIKNIVLYCIFSVLITVYSLKNIKLLYFTISFVKFNQGMHYVPQLKYKILMLKYILFFSLAYPTGYILLIIIQNLFFNTYVEIDNSFFEIINCTLYDCLFVVILVSLFFPKKLPRYFKVYFVLKLKNYNGRILKAILPNKEYLISSQNIIYNLQDFEYEEGKKVIPLVILKPTFKENFLDKKKYQGLEEHECAQQIIFDKVNLGYLSTHISRYITNLGNSTNDQTIENDIL